MEQGEATTVDVRLFNDIAKQEMVETVTPALASLFSYAHQWAQKSRRSDACTLTFSSMLAAMMASEKPLCRWLQRHLGLRGVAAETMTHGWRFELKPLPERLITSSSFRTACAAARKLRGDASPAQPLDARHLMAAYAVCPQYHLLDFLRLRIDRRAWCLDLADHLCRHHPDEDVRWKAYATLALPIPVLQFNTDAPEGRDLLAIDREVEAFSRLVAARTTHTPLSIGVFGAWGSGKSFFMRRLRDGVARLGEIGNTEGRGSPYHGRIAQIEFNAWHYSEGTLIACLVDHIFRNLRIGVEDEDDVTLRRRSAELIIQLDRAKQGLAEREHELEEAEARQLEAARKLASIEARIPEIVEQRRAMGVARASLASAERELAQAQAQQRDEIELAIAKAPLRAAVAVLRTGIANPHIAAAEQAVRDLIGAATDAGARWLPIVLGLVVLAIGMLATALVESEGKVYGHVISAITALGTLAAASTTWLKKLASIAKTGEAFQQAEAKLAEAAVQAVEASYKPVLDGLQATISARTGVVTAAQTELDRRLAEPGIAQGELTQLDQARAIALDQHAQAMAEVAARKDALGKLGSGSLLGEFLDERAMTDGYRKNLTIFTQVRNDFERLSKLLAHATDEYYANNKPAPAVSRIVLYIDDLDRCPEDKVIEVLRTVHLLLAFPLFVCVVAVDPRWVNTCLRKAPGLLDHVARPGGATEAAGTATQLDETLGKPATPADYLEKIFQIPLWLRPVPAAKRPDIVRALFDPLPELALTRPMAPVITALASSDSSSTTSAAPTAAAAAAAEIEAMTTAIRPGPADNDSGIDTSAAGATVRPPTDLTIDAVELDYLGQLGGLLDGNPRALKRFVNTYRLVKSSLSDVELEVFRSQLRMAGEGDATYNAQYLPYRMCMAQLAVLCTQRERALRMVRAADRHPATLGAWLAEVREEDDELADLFRAVLTTNLADPSQVSFETFALWLERTRRYSFYL